MKWFGKSKTPEVDFEEQRKDEIYQIGLCLGEFRQHRQLDLTTVSRQIHIPASLLVAIEKGDLGKLPEPIYTRELLRKYANYLGLNGDEFASHFNINSNRRKKRGSGRKFGLARLIPNLEVKPVYLYFTYIVLMAISVNSLSNFLQTSPLESKSTSEIEKRDLKPESELNPPQKLESPLIPVTDRKGENPAPPAELMVKIVAEDECWLRVIVDGNKVFEGVISKGEKQKWVAEKELTIRAGNAGGLLVGLNEGQAKKLGKPGQVQEVTFELPRRS